jgi:ABC-type branched-subunit amino acid transport system substrate-binding protein
MKAHHGWLLGVCLALGACGGDDAGNGDTASIKLGLLAPKSGELAEWGRQMERSALFAVDELNRAGGIDGRKLQLLVKDTAADSAKAVKAARELIGAGVVVIIGPGTSSEAVAVIEQVTRAAKMPMISPGATSPQLTTFDDDDTFFRTIASDAFQGKVLAQRIYDDGHRTLALIHRDDPYGVGLRDTISEAFAALGGQVTQVVSYGESKVMNFDAEVAALLPQNNEPDAVALLSFHEDGANITRDVQALGLSSLPSFYGVDGVYSVEFAMAGAAPIVEGLIGTAPVAATDDPNFIKTQRAFTDLTGAASDFDGGSYDAVCIAALAFAAAGEVSSQAIIDQVRQVTRPDGASAMVINAEEWKKGFAAAAAGKDIDYAGASGPADLDDAGDTARGFFVFWQAHAGEGEEASVDAVGEPVAFP